MLLLQNINRLLRTNPNQVVDGKPQDVEKAFQSPRRGLKLTRLPVYQSPIYRGLPIIAGVFIPFSILLSIPSLTDRWYIRVDANNVTLESRPNPFLLNLGMGFSMACGVLANICLIVRFSERKVLRMTWLCILFLTLHGECQ
jgi:hypothetical protein